MPRSYPNIEFRKGPSQEQMFYAAEKRSADLNSAFLELVGHPTNPITRSDLATLIKRRPERYARFAGFLDKLPA